MKRINVRGAFGRSRASLRFAALEPPCSSEGRYKSQALLDEAAVLTCMSYVDLNPIRAGIAETPETSDYTSIQQRIERWRNDRQNRRQTTPSHPPIMRLVKQCRDPHGNAIGYTAKDYLELVDWAGRAIRDDKRGAIAQNLPPILERLQLDPEIYLKHVGGKRQGAHHPRALGAAHKLRALADQLGQKFIRGAGHLKTLYLA